MKTNCCNSYFIKDKYNNTYCSHCLKSNPKPIKGKNWTLYFLFVLVMLGVYSFCKAPDIQNYIKYTIIQQDSCEHISDIALIKELYNDDCVLIAVAVSQAKIEAGNSYNSNIAQQNNNIFGIKWHKCQYVVSKNLEHATYKNWKDCCKCYVKLQNKYLKAINGKYAENKDYITVIKQMK